MWLAMEDGFLSIVQDGVDKEILKVRARRREHLVRFLAPLESAPEIIFNFDTDYAWRVFLPRKVVSSLVAERVANIDYDNFKNRAKKQEPELAKMYSMWWFDHYQYQENDPRWWSKAAKKPGGAKKKGRHGGVSFLRR